MRGLSSLRSRSLYTILALTAALLLQYSLNDPAIAGFFHEDPIFKYPHRKYLNIRSSRNLLSKQDNLEKTISGHPKIIDGDSIVLNDLEIRLKGIDAPEYLQKCGDAQHPYSCGITAKKHLSDLIKNQIVTCHYNIFDIYNRALAYCFVNDIFINKKMIEDGWAVSFYEFKKEQAIAKRNKLGLWAAPFQIPKYWRKEYYAKHPRHRKKANLHLLQNNQTVDLPFSQ